MTYDAKLRELGVFSMEKRKKRRLRGNLSDVHNCCLDQKMQRR